MTLGIIIPLVALPIVLALLWRWYTTSFRQSGSDPQRTISGVRLTAEALHRLQSPTLRVVYEIGDRLPGVDHIVVGPAGIAAIRTAAADRPTLAQLLDGRTEASLVAESAMARGAVDDFLAGAAGTCDLLAHVYWGAADDHRAAAEDSIHATVFVEGQRLDEWLTDWTEHAPPRLDAAGIDAAWRAITVGVGRPDPLA